MENKKKADIIVMIGRVFFLLAISGTILNVILMFKGLFTSDMGTNPFPMDIFTVYWPLVGLGYFLCIILINWKDLLTYFGGLGSRFKNFILYGEFEE